MMDAKRRLFLQQASAGSVAAVLCAAGLLRPTAVWASEWPRAAFQAASTKDVFKVLNAGTPAAARELVLKTPDIAENGAEVEVEISSQLPNTTQLWVLVDKNPQPLAAQFSYGPDAVPQALVRLKLGQSSTVRVLARAGDKLYLTSREVQVTIGGCGG